MLEYVPTLGAAGTADSWHLVLLKLSQDGWFAIEHFSASPSASETVGTKLYQMPTLAAVGGVPEIFGAAAYVLNGASNTAQSARAMAIVGTRAARACAFLVEEGMRIPMRVTTTRRRTRRSSHPHTEIPYRLTRSWSAIACMRLADATECLRCEARAVNRSFCARAKCLHGQT